MRILLLGEYSRLHSSLKEGLMQLGHEVILISSGDGFKKFPADFSYEAKWSKTKILNIPRQILFRLFKYDIANLEHGIRFYFLLKKLKGFDVVQLINERPIQTHSKIEIFLLKRVMKNNNKIFVLSCGVDYLSVKFMLERKIEKSILNPLFEDKSLGKEFDYILEYVSEKHQLLHKFIYNNCNGIIASDIDYVLPLKGNPKFIGLIPNPVNISHFPYQELQIKDTIVIFLGINQWNFHQKGIVYFQKALEIVKKKYGEKIEILIAKNIPYQEYINLYNRAHILLDQVYAYDQGYNALEAMAKGKVVFTGAEKEFENEYMLKEKVAINAKPDLDYLVEQLSYLIENPKEIIAIGKRARAFIESEHHYVTIAGKYTDVWKAN